MKRHSRKHIFSIYTDFNDPDADAVVISEKFSLWAFLFHGFWLLYHRAFIAALLWFAAFAGVGIIGKLLGMDTNIIMILQLAMQLWLGFEGHYLRSFDAERRGLSFDGVFVAANEEEAELRYYENHARYLSVVPVTPRAPYPPVNV